MTNIVAATAGAKIVAIPATIGSAVTSGCRKGNK